MAALAKRTYQYICVLTIIPPVGTDLALTSNVPNVQLETIWLDHLYVEALMKDNIDLECFSTLSSRWRITTLFERLFGTCVGVMWLMSSAASCFSIVVLPALSKPSNSKRTSWSGVCFSLRKMDNSPCSGGWVAGDELQWDSRFRHDIL